MGTIVSISQMRKLRLGKINCCPQRQAANNACGEKWKPGLNYPMHPFIHGVREFLWPEAPKEPNSFLVKAHLPGSDYEYHLSALQFMAFFHLDYLSVLQPGHPSPRLLWEVPGLAKTGYGPLRRAKNKSQAPRGTWSPTVTVIPLVENTVLPFPWPPLQRRKCFSAPRLPSLKES